MGAPAAIAQTAVPQGIPPLQVSLRPSGPEGEVVEGPGYFVVTGEPGATLSLYALVSLGGSSAADVSLVPVDATTSGTGGISYNLPDQPRQDVGAWLSLSVTTLHLEPGQGMVVPIRLTVPAGTRPGQHIGGLTAFIPNATNQQGGQFVLQVQTRAVTAVQVNVPGAEEARLAITGVTAEERPDATYLVVRIRNAGTVLLKGQGTLVVTRAGETAPLVSAPLTVDTTIPGTEAAYPIAWMKQPPAGAYRAHVDLTWEGGSTAFDSPFTVTPPATATPRPGASPVFIATINPVATTPPGGAGSGKAAGGASGGVPLGVVISLIAGLVVVFGVVLLLVLRRR